MEPLQILAVLGLITLIVIGSLVLPGRIHKITEQIKTNLDPEDGILSMMDPETWYLMEEIFDFFEPEERTLSFFERVVETTVYSMVDEGKLIKETRLNQQKTQSVEFFLLSHGSEWSVEPIHHTPQRELIPA